MMGREKRGLVSRKQTNDLRTEGTSPIKTTPGNVALVSGVNSEMHTKVRTYSQSTFTGT